MKQNKYLEDLAMLKAGFARLDITPPLGTHLDGYFYERHASSVLDPLELNAIALNDGEKTVVLIAADLMAIAIEDVKHIKKRIEERLGLCEECVLIHAIHQHNSFWLDNMVKPYRLPSAYIELLYTKFVDVAQLAIEDMAEATLSSGEKETDKRIAFTRRFKLDDGRTVTNPYPEEIPHIDHRIGEADNIVRILRFKREGKKDIALVNFSAHPDVVKGDKITADWPGFTRRFVEADLGDVNCAFFTNAQGDVAHRDIINGYSKQGYEHSRYMGRVIADAVIKIWDSTTERKADKLFAAISVVYNKSNTSGEEEYEESKAFYAENSKNPGVSGQYLGYAKRVIAIRESMTIYTALPVTVMGIGEVVLFGLPGEPFHQYAEIARNLAKGKFALTFCITNGYQGYLPTAEAFAEGGYEARSSHFTPALEEQITNEAKKLIDMI